MCRRRAKDLKTKLFMKYAVVFVYLVIITSVVNTTEPVLKYNVVCTVRLIEIDVLLRHKSESVPVVRYVAGDTFSTGIRWRTWYR